MKKKHFIFDAIIVSVHCFILSMKNFVKLAEQGTGKFQNVLKARFLFLLNEGQ